MMQMTLFSNPRRPLLHKMVPTGFSSKLVVLTGFWLLSTRLFSVFKVMVFDIECFCNNS